jgi:hypothetical protein
MTYAQKYCLPRAAHHRSANGLCPPDPFRNHRNPARGAHVPELAPQTGPQTGQRHVASPGGAAEVDKKPNFIEFYEISRFRNSNTCFQQQLELGSRVYLLERCGDTIPNPRSISTYCGGLRARNHRKRTFGAKVPIQKPPNRSIGRILDTCPKTRFRYVTVTTSECGQSRPRFRPWSFSNVRRKTANVITGDGLVISICSRTWRRFRKKSTRKAAS